MLFKYVLFIGVYDNKFNRSLSCNHMTESIVKFVSERPETYSVLKVGRKI